MGNELVSIVIPMYNAELYVGKMIESIIAQIYKHWELIIVDDNSTDNSCNIVRSFSRQYNNIKLYIKTDKDRKGANSSRNIGTRLSAGEYIVYFDADDLVTNYCISQRVAFMEKNSHIDFAVFPAITFRNVAFDLTTSFGYKQNYCVMGHFLSGLLPFAVWTNIYRSSSLKDNAITWDEDLPCLQDSVFNVMSLSKGLKFKFSNSAPDYLWRFFGNKDSISKKIYTDKRLLTRIDVLNMFSNITIGRISNGALLLRSFYIYMSVINSNYTSAKDIFFDADIFKSHKILLHKLKLHYDFIRKHHVSNRFIILMLLFLVSPLYTFRGLFFNQIRKIRLQVLYLSMKRRYKDVVENGVSY